VSVFGDAMKAIREVLLMQARMDQFDERVTRMSGDLDGLADLCADLRDRVSRLEGIIEGVGMASAAARPSRPRLPKK
jgi:archaellum component FlaC